MINQTKNLLPVRFLRSTHLERDFYDAQALSCYVLTDTALAGLKRLASGMRPESGQRAWRIIGDYGSGKSSFALLLAHWFSGNVKKIPGSLSSKIQYADFGINKPRLVPILVTGAREPLGITIQRGIQDAISYHYPNGLGKCKINSLLKKEALPDIKVIKLISLVNERMRSDNKGKGLLLIIDELGKSLEYAASAVSENDVFLMQRLAEEASRSGDTPFFLIGILHQGFGAYASCLGLESRQEWEKVAGRYDEIVFNHPLEQTAAIIAEALSVLNYDLSEKQIETLENEMTQTINLGWYGSAGNPEMLKSLSSRLFPLAPSVLPAMTRILHRFGQNQRSVFSFLFGSEAFALRAFIAESSETYKLHNLYDYIHSNLGHYLSSAHTITNWSTIDTLVQSYSTDDPQKIEIIKTIGILNLLNDSALVPTEQTLSLCISGKSRDKNLSAKIQELKSDAGKKILYDRGTLAGGLCLWSHLSVDLEKYREEALSAIGPTTNPAEFIQGSVTNLDIVARRHYILTGNLRHFSVVFCDVNDLGAPGDLILSEADGTIFLPLCLNLADTEKAVQLATTTEMKDKNKFLIVVPKALTGLTPYIREVQIWNWIRSNAKNLNGDRFARETVSRKYNIAKQALESAITEAIGLNDLRGCFTLQCFWKGQLQNISSGREFSSKLSDICDELFDLAPVVQNELINRRSISSAAAAARMRLIKRMLEAPEKPLLDMDNEKKPPEMSMYMSIMQAGKIHLQDADNVCKIVIPSLDNDPLKLWPVFNRLDELLQENTDQPVNVKIIREELESQPYGVRQGLIPLLIAIYYSVNKHNIAFFEDGTFLSEVSDADFLKLSKKPDLFQMQHCNVEGLRSVAFRRLASTLKIATNDNIPLDLLDVVRPLCFIVAKLPSYTQKTKRLSLQALAVRHSIIDAKDPLKLLFTSLPVDCGCQPILANEGNSKNAEEFVKLLPKIIDELLGAYSQLQQRNKEALLNCFSFSQKNNSKLRQDLNTRADVLFSFVSEQKLKAFCFRLKDTVLPEADWLDSISSMVVSKPPDKWLDEDEQAFNQNLSELSGQFLRTEGIAFDSKGNSRDGAIRICVTLPTGDEEKKVLAVNKEDEKLISALQCQIKELITKHGDIALVAASQAVWDNLQGK